MEEHAEEYADHTSSTNPRQWAMFIHFAQFCAYVIPLAGIIVPIVLWQMKKDESEYIDEHGKNVVNWLITSFIYTAIALLLCLAFVGFPLLIAILVVDVVFPIIGGIRANNGETWVYPLTIRFIR